MSKGFQVALVSAILLLTLAVTGLGAYLFLGPNTPLSQSGESAATTKGQPDTVVFFKTKNFVTNLADTDRPRFVDVTIALGLKDQVALENAKKLEPQIRDTVLGYLRLRGAADLAGSAGKERLGEALERGLADLLKGSLVKVYLTDLTVQ